MDIENKANGFLLSARVRRQINSTDVDTNFLFRGEIEDVWRLRWDESARYLSVRIGTSMEWFDWIASYAYELTWDGETETIGFMELGDWELAEEPFRPALEAWLPNRMHRVAIDQGHVVLATHDGEVVRRFEEAPNEVHSLAVSHDCRVLFAAGKSGCWIGRLESGETLTWIPGPILGVAAHPFNRTFATVSVNRDSPRVILRLWELDNDALRSMDPGEAFRLPPDAWNTWRIIHHARRVTLSRINGSMRNLTGIDLRDARLDGANLRRSRLSWACLNDVDLRHADLTEADLTGASLRGANLTEARLAGAHLRGADLSGATLLGADLTEAKLDNAELSGATLGWTVFGRNNLNRTKGLDGVEHKGHSVLGLDTLLTLPNPLPLHFLRGCGASERLIDTLPALLRAAAPMEFYSCFISYSHADRAFAQRLHDRLQARGVRCWLDEHQLLPGDDIYTGVDTGIRRWDKVLLCASRASLNSWWVDNEIGIAFEKEQALSKERGGRIFALIPLDLDGFLFSGGWPSGKAAELRRRAAADFRGWESDGAKFDLQLERVVRALRVDPDAREAPPEPRL